MRHSSILPRFTLGILPLVCFVAAGCSSNSGSTAPPANPPSLSLNQALARAVPSTVTVPTEIDTTASLLFTIHFDGALKGAGAAFLNGSQLVDAGNVWTRTLNAAVLDSVQLTEVSGVVSGHQLIVYGSMASIPPMMVNIPFDGSTYHVFHVAGSASVAAFIDSMKSVHDLHVNSPAADTTRSRSSDFTVHWDDAGGDAGVKVVATVISGADTTLKAAATMALDSDGAATIPTAALMRLPAGAAKLAIARYRLVYKLIGVRMTGFLCETVVVRNLTLN